MNALLSALHRHARQRPAQAALITSQHSLNYAELAEEVDKLAAQLQFLRIATLALHADNGIGWIVADLAAMAAGVRCVPLPCCFPDARLRNALHDSGADAVLADDDRFAAFDGWLTEPQAICCRHWRLLRRKRAAPVRLLPANTRKISYSPRLNGDPRGRCVDLDAQLRPAAALAAASGTQAGDRHVCVLPLSTLSENIGVYATLLCGATVCAPTLAETGMRAAAQVDAAALLAALRDADASTATLTPQLLPALVAAGESGAAIPARLRFIAIGGAPVSPPLLRRAHRLGLPVCEGYGCPEPTPPAALARPAPPRRDGNVFHSIEARRKAS